MTPQQFELLYTISNEDFHFENRYRAALEIVAEANQDHIEIDEVSLFYKAMLDFWRSLGKTKKDRDNSELFFPRKKLAWCCWHLSRKLPGMQRFFRYYPKIEDVAGFESRVKKEIIRGAFKTGYGTSLYEFHWEYPIEGFGVRKDLISVNTENGEKIPLLEWCQENEIVVYCNRCGLDITYEVSKDCPFWKRK